MHKIIEGVLTEDKRLRLLNVTALSVGENLTTTLKISLPQGLAGYGYYIEFDCEGKSCFSEQLAADAENKVNYTIPFAALSRTGTVKVQLTAINTEDSRVIFKSVLSDESCFYVFSSINAENVAVKIIPNAITRAEETANSCLSAAAEAVSSGEFARQKGEEALSVSQGLLQDKQNGVFNGANGINGEKGEKGDKGDKGDRGECGTDGKSAYVQALEGGYMGSLQNFVTDLLTISAKYDKQPQINVVMGGDTLNLFAPNFYTAENGAPYTVSGEIPIKFNGSGSGIKETGLLLDVAIDTDLKFSNAEILWQNGVMPKFYKGGVYFLYAKSYGGGIWHVSAISYRAV